MNGNGKLQSEIFLKNHLRYHVDYFSLANDKNTHHSSDTEW